MKKTNLFLLITVLSLILFSISCKKVTTISDDPQAFITTADVSLIMTSTATCGGIIYADAGILVIQRGLCWSTAPEPTIDDFYTNQGDGGGSFVANLTGLTPNTKYFIRAYATTEDDTYYGTINTFRTGREGTINDIEGNVYPYVQIGSQVWMAKDLRTTKFSNTTPIQKLVDVSLWQGATTPAYSWHADDSTSYADIYGALYNFYAADANNLCPSGWHVPSTSEWIELLDYLGGSAVAGGMLKAVGDDDTWDETNIGATNLTGFNSHSGGYRSSTGGYSVLGNNAHYYASDQFNDANAYYFYILSNSINVVSNNVTKQHGFAVRCVED